MNTFILLILALLASTYASTSIIGGEPVGENDVIASMIVGVKVDPGRFCTGSILDNETILTAGHCVKPNQNRLIAFGLNLVSVNPGMTRPVTGIKFYDSYHGDQRRDYALRIYHPCRIRQD
ncbi:MAG TPA: trypsin-like serine protease [Bacteriovoracaceae bacterium]|nr:trypsin-like serine protease [Bacteriovoracaceae bacterium]